MAYGKSRLTNPEIVRLEIERPSKEHEAMLRHASAQLRRVANVCVMSWLVYHYQRQSLMSMMAGQPVHPCPPELCARWLREGQAIAPDVHCATVLAVTNWLAQTITAQKSPKTNEKRWRAVLRHDESHWTFTRDLPIRLWNGNAKMERTPTGACVVVRVDRFDRPGKKTAGSTPIALQFVKPKQSNRTAGHRLAYLAACEMADGTRKFAQSQIVNDGGKWFLNLTVDGPAPEQHAARDASRVLCVRPGRHNALRIHADTKSGGFGDEILDRISQVRSAMDNRRASWRKENGSTPLPLTVREQMSLKWRQSANTMCDQLACKIAAALNNESYGKVLWLDGNNRMAALALAGRNGERDKRELFPFERLRDKATKKLVEMGIEVVDRANFRSVKRRRSEGKKRKVLASGGV